ncbi:Putative protein of unknown function [Podospora comata]|uniref:Protein kinase domain-containing protein n=1 Tax=Podospora comata TaxID=48703 RepID=A0ABY6SAI7_PODCO|nr:Putative protein of unknown function [Podospora comata]
MTDILGAIDASISLAERFRSFVNSYAGAEEAAATMRLFDGQLGTMRLKLLRRGLNSYQNNFASNDIATIRSAITELHSKLDKAIGLVPDPQQKSKTILRVQWATGLETTVMNEFETINGGIDNLQSIVNLAMHTLKLKPLNHGREFKLILHQGHEEQDLGPRGYSTMAVLPPSYRSDHPVRVFVETYRDSSKATALARHVATRLWWTSDNLENTDFLRGVLPCIGFDGYRVIYLLPKDSKDRQTLRKLIDSKKVSLEARFSLALQLAKAVLKVHSDGLAAHCSIRSNTILFLTSDGTRVSEVKAPPEPPEAAAPPGGGGGGLVRRNTLKQGINRVGTGIKEISTTIKRTMSFSARKRDREDIEDRRSRDRGAGNRAATRKSSQQSLRKRNVPRKVKGKGAIWPGARSNDSSEDLPDSVCDEQDKMASKKDSVALSCEVSNAHAPPGFGSLYLTHWQHVVHRGAPLGNFPKDWTKDVYRHPEQHGQTEATAKMGHDIYSMGVCLLEIGLWRSFSVLKDGSLEPSALGEAAGMNIKENYEAVVVKQNLVEIARRELPVHMGERYAQVVAACLTCLDTDEIGPNPTWGEGFGSVNTSEGAKCSRFRKVVVSPLEHLGDALTERSADHE